MENKIINIIKLQENKESFLQYLDISELTLNSYKNGINSFIKFLEENGITNPTRNDFKAFREEFKKNMSINTVNSYMTAVRSFFKYLNANGIYEDITKDVKSLKTSNVARVQVLSADQCKKIYSEITDKREKALFSLAITTGLRANELATCRIDNIKVFNGEIVLFVKCKKRDDENEYVKLSETVYRDILDYIGDRSEGCIFVSTSNNNHNGGISNASVRNIVKGIFKRYGINQDWFSCHTLRKSMATISYLNGGDIVEIQQVLHHSSIATTRRYISQCTRDNNKLEYKVSDMILG